MTPDQLKQIIDAIHAVQDQVLMAGIAMALGMAVLFWAILTQHKK